VKVELSPPTEPHRGPHPPEDPAARGSDLLEVAAPPENEAYFDFKAALLEELERRDDVESAALSSSFELADSTTTTPRKDETEDVPDAEGATGSLSRSTSSGSFAVRQPAPAVDPQRSLTDCICDLLERFDLDERAVQRVILELELDLELAR
jgi:hypothetical protein